MHGVMAASINHYGLHSSSRKSYTKMRSATGADMFTNEDNVFDLEGRTKLQLPSRAVHLKLDQHSSSGTYCMASSAEEVPLWSIAGAQ